MDKLKMMSMDKVQENIQKIRELFPNAVTEVLRDGAPTLAVDFDVLKQELANTLIDERELRYQMMWPDKQKSVLLANTPISATLRPCKEESVDFDNTQNLYIEGDNLDVLKLLQETYLEKMDVIYIDPPYNTGNDILYKNDYSETQDEFGDRYEIDDNGNRLYTNTDTNGRYHTDWMNMMYQRIRIAKDLLKDTGFFLLAIDHNELFNIGEICDEIFGYSNRIGIISVVHKPEGRNQAKFIGPSNEFMLIYAKNESLAKLQKVVLDEEQSKAFECSDEKGAYRLKNFIRLSDGKYATRESKPTFWYPIYVSQDLSRLSITEFTDSIAVYPVTDSGVERTWKTTKETFIERYNSGDITAKQENGKIIIYEKLREDQVIKTHWIDRKYHGFHFGTKVLDDILGVKTFDFPKSLFLMRDIYKLFAPKDALIMDFFSGSATSAHAIMKLNSEDGGKRKYIMVQIAATCDKNSEAYKAGYKNICEIGKERIRRAGAKIYEEKRKAKGQPTRLDLFKQIVATTEIEQQHILMQRYDDAMQGLDVGFRVLKLDSSNMKEVYYKPEQYSQSLLSSFEDNIKEDRTPLDLLFQVMLELGKPLSAKIKEKEIAGKKVFIVDDNDLIACFDNDVTDEVVKTIAQLKPLYAVFRDSSLSSDSTAANFDQIFATYSPNTTRKVL